MDRMAGPSMSAVRRYHCSRHIFPDCKVILLKVILPFLDWLRDFFPLMWDCNGICRKIATRTPAKRVVLSGTCCPRQSVANNINSLLFLTELIFLCVAKSCIINCIITV